jgi:hypothetical protein
LAFAPDILVAIMTTTFDLEPELAEHLEKLCWITNLGAGELINLILEPPLSQIIEDHDTYLLQGFIHPLVFDTKEEALDIIARYEHFDSEDEDSGVYRYDVAPARTRDGHWEIKFKSTHPWDEGEAIYQ